MTTTTGSVELPAASPAPAGPGGAAEQLRIESAQARAKLLAQPQPQKRSALYEKIKAAQPGQELVSLPEMQAFLRKSGYLTDEQAARERRAEERQALYRRQEMIERFRGECGVPKRYAKADLDDVSFVEQNSPDVLVAYVAARDRLARLIDRPGTVLCHGKNGPGKSHQASALVNRFVSLGRSARYATASSFFVELVSTFDAPGRTKAALSKRYQSYELLVIDEYEVRGESKFHEQILRSLVDARYAEVLSTVLITNLDIDDINDRLPRSVRDRIRGTGDVIHYEWGSLRRFGEEQ